MFYQFKKYLVMGLFLPFSVASAAELHEPHQNTVAPGQVCTWHFVQNKINKRLHPAPEKPEVRDNQITVVFNGADEITADPTKSNKKVDHFYVTSDSDGEVTLLTANTVIDPRGTEGSMLVLSSLECGPRQVACPCEELWNDTTMGGPGSLETAQFDSNLQPDLENNIDNNLPFSFTIACGGSRADGTEAVYSYQTLAANEVVPAKRVCKAFSRTTSDFRLLESFDPNGDGTADTADELNACRTLLEEQNCIFP